MSADDVPLTTEHLLRRIKRSHKEVAKHRDSAHAAAKRARAELDKQIAEGVTTE